MVFVKSLRDGTLTLKSGNPTSSIVVLAEGDLSIEETQEVLEIKDRGTLHDVKKGDEVPVKVSFSFKWYGYEVADSGANPYEHLTRTGTAAAYTTTRTTSDVMMDDLEFLVAGVGGSTEETITLSDFFHTGITMKEGDPNMMSVTGMAWVTKPTIS